jgi:hypothetical protein
LYIPAAHLHGFAGLEHKNALPDVDIALEMGSFGLYMIHLDDVDILVLLIVWP